MTDRYQLRSTTKYMKQPQPSTNLQIRTQHPKAPLHGSLSSRNTNNIFGTKLASRKLLASSGAKFEWMSKPAALKQPPRRPIAITARNKQRVRLCGRSLNVYHGSYAKIAAIDTTPPKRGTRLRMPLSIDHFLNSSMTSLSSAATAPFAPAACSAFAMSLLFVGNMKIIV